MPPSSNRVTKRTRNKTAKRTPMKTSLQTDKAVYFWRETDPDFGFLSQWYYCPFREPEDPSIVYPTAEHYMMYHKALLLEDTAAASAILADPSPQTARRLDRTVTPFSDETWEANRERIVTEGSLAKFRFPVSEEGFRRGIGKEAGDLRVVDGETDSGADRADDEEKDRKLGRLAAALLETGDKEIVETSLRDRIWGVGFGAKKKCGRAEGEMGVEPPGGRP